MPFAGFSVNCTLIQFLCGWPEGTGWNEEESKDEVHSSRDVEDERLGHGAYSVDGDDKAQLVNI